MDDVPPPGAPPPCVDGRDGMPGLLGVEEPCVGEGGRELKLEERLDTELGMDDTAVESMSKLNPAKGLVTPGVRGPRDSQMPEEGRSAGRLDSQGLVGWRMAMGRAEDVDDVEAAGLCEIVLARAKGLILDEEDGTGGGLLEEVRPLNQEERSLLDLGAASAAAGAGD